MRLTEYLISEMRKNPKQNPRSTPMQQLQEIAKKYGPNNIYVRYVNVPKLGHTIKSQYDTPLGMCAYPLNHVLGVEGDVEWAGGGRYILVFKSLPNAHIWDLGTFDKAVVGKMAQSIKDVMGVDLWRDMDYITTNKQLWVFMYNVARSSAAVAQASPKRFRTAAATGIVTRRILRNMGFDGIVDPGMGIIHRNEPNQAVFFDTKKLKQLDLITNKYNPPLTDMSKLWAWWNRDSERGNIFQALSKYATGDYLYTTVAKLGNTIMNTTPNAQINTLLPPQIAKKLVNYGFDIELYNKLDDGEHWFTNKQAADKFIKRLGALDNTYPGNVKYLNNLVKLIGKLPE
jgi:hypothetical protein